jgi:drug/metabolite transporter (DMT)-like permease
MGTILALAAAVLYGSADFLGGAAARRARPLAVLAITTPAGAVITVVAAAVAGAAGLGGSGLPGPAGLAWGAAAGAAGTAGLLMFYAGFSMAPMSVVAPISALASALLPLGVAIAQGERPGPLVIAGGVICLVAVVLVSLERKSGERAAAARLRGLGYGLASGIMFGLFFLFFRSAGASGVLWPVAVARLAGTAIAFAACLAAWVRPAWRGSWVRAAWRGSPQGVLPLALASGTVDASANICYVLATRTGLFGIAVVITALYPGMTVLLARFVLGERMRWLQRTGLVLAGAGLILVTI